MHNIKKIVLASLLLAIGMVLPFFTMQIKTIGNMLLPMHIPVFLCGLILGAPFGFLVGFILPIFRSMIFGMPMFYPSAVAMSFELATYGFVSGYIYNNSKYQCIVILYKSLIIAMISGRVVWGIVSIFLYEILGKSFTYQIFIFGALLNTIPGIIIQLILIPIIMLILNKTNLVKFKRNSNVVNKMEK